MSLAWIDPSVLLAEFEVHLGLIVIIAFLLGMGTPTPGRNAPNWSELAEGLSHLAQALKALRPDPTEKGADDDHGDSDGS